MRVQEEHDCAVALCCDQNYFHLALFMIRQIAFHNPNRKFDFVIASQDDLQLPDWAKPLAIRLHRCGELPESAVCATSPQAIIYTDQSLTNIALHGKFAQLAPCWNWQCNARLPWVPLLYPVFLRHFIGLGKPDRTTSGLLEIRYNQAYRDFLQQLMPDRLPQLAPLPDPVPLTLPQAARIALKHILARPVVAEYLKRHPDPYKAII